MVHAWLSLFAMRLAGRHRLSPQHDIHRPVGVYRLQAKCKPSIFSVDDVVLSNKMDGTRLRTLLAHFLNQAHFSTDCQHVKITFDQAVAMKVDELAIGGLDSSEIVVRVEFNDPSMCRRLMRLDLALLVAGVFLDLATHGVKGIANGNINVAVSAMLVRFTACHQFPLRHLDVDADVVMIALVMVPVQGFYRDTATHDVLVKISQLFCTLANLGLDSLRALQITESDLQW